MDLILFIPVLLASVVLHEVAHAWQARREGDPTAHALGRITLNPLPHLDLVGSFLVPAVLYAGGGVIFGWARPVPVDPRNFRDHPASDIRVSLAGIVANVGLAAALLVLGGPLLAGTRLVPGIQDMVWTVVTTGIFLNLVLAVFNLLPVPPLDGSHVVANLLPARAARLYRRMAPFGIGVLLLVVVLLPDAFGVVLSPIRYLMGFVVEWLQLWT